MINEITPKYIKGDVIKECPNPRFLWVYSKEIKKKIPVMIPRRMIGKLDGKRITIEAIEDASGTSYRYAKP